MNGYKFGIDAAHHNTFNYDEVKKHIDFAFLRVSFGTTPDKLFERHYDGFKEIPIAAWQWFRPDQDVKEQIELAKRALDGKNIRVFFSDQEQESRYGIPIPRYTPTYLSERGRQHVEGLALHGLEVGVYSRTQWIIAYAKPMLDWIFNYDNWWASYPYAKGTVTTSWDQLINYWAPKTFSPYLNAGWPAGAKKAEAWQWSGDKFIVPGIFNNPTAGTPVPRSADFNYISDALFNRLAGSTPPPPAPTLEEMVRILWDAHPELHGG